MYGKSQWDIILESLTEPFVFISDCSPYYRNNIVLRKMIICDHILERCHETWWDVLSNIQTSNK